MENKSGLMYENKERRLKVYIIHERERYKKKYEESKQKKPTGIMVQKTYRQEERKKFRKEDIHIFSLRDVRMYHIPAFKVVNFLVFGDGNWPNFLRKQEKYMTKDFDHQPSKDAWQLEEKENKSSII